KIHADEDRLESYKKRIDRFRETVEDMEEGPARSRKREKYRSALADYKRKKRLLEENRASFRKQKRTYKNKRSDYRNRITAAGLGSTFKTTLKDGRVLYTYLVTVSRNLDLALLKLDDYQTPYLVPAESPGQGETVYAIGSPLGLKDTVSKGIVSGFEKGFIKTDAKIYPGNSGGPLVTEQGRVIGANTFKKITRKFEGLGFAIPIHAIIDEFSGNIQ
ncbi:MAG: S1C family serine protease, partial [Desulfarculaceae bacterium]|nr:S1C family serine protease [Desulfarculaceae bacterium]